MYHRYWDSCRSSSLHYLWNHTHGGNCSQEGPFSVWEICKIEESKVEKQLARRQMPVHDVDSSSWYIAVHRLLIGYDLPDGWTFLDTSLQKQHGNQEWTNVSMVTGGIWMKERAYLYLILQYLNSEDYNPGKKHGLIRLTREVRDVTRLKTKLKLMAGSYTLQGE